MCSRITLQDSIWVGVHYVREKYSKDGLQHESLVPVTDPDCMLNIVVHTIVLMQGSFQAKNGGFLTILSYFCLHYLPAELDQTQQSSYVLICMAGYELGNPGSFRRPFFWGEKGSRLVIGLSQSPICHIVGWGEFDLFYFLWVYEDQESLQVLQRPCCFPQFHSNYLLHSTYLLLPPRKHFNKLPQETSKCDQKF